MASRTIVDFLNNTLLRPGPSQLPYAEDSKWEIRQHILDFVREFDNIGCKLKAYTQPDGRTVTLLFLEGTIPIYHRGVQYNIPIVVWLPEKYPRTPPFFYVTPTPDMLIKADHSFVDANGLVRSVYFTNWTFPRSNLNEMAHDMAIQFGTEPPLYTKPSNWVNPDPTPLQTPAQSTLGSNQGHSSPGQALFPVRPPPSAQQGHSVAMHNPLQAGQQSMSSVWGRPPPGGQQTVSAAEPAQPAVTVAQLEGDFRKAAIATIADRLQDRYQAHLRSTDAALKQVAEVQQRLTAKEAQIDSMVSAAAVERDSLERSMADLAVRLVELDSWLDEYEEKAARAGAAVSPDDAIVPVDALSSRALDAHAADLAIEETLYALDKAIKKGIVPPDIYLKQVRQLCRKQYFARALGNKVARQQHEAVQHMTGSQARMANTASLHMPQGDSWVGTGVHMPNPLASMH